MLAGRRAYSANRRPCRASRRHYAASERRGSHATAARRRDAAKKIIEAALPCDDAWRFSNSPNEMPARDFDQARSTRVTNLELMLAANRAETSRYHVSFAGRRDGLLRHKSFGASPRGMHYLPRRSRSHFIICAEKSDGDGAICGKCRSSASPRK